MAEGAGLSLSISQHKIGIMNIIVFAEYEWSFNGERLGLSARPITATPRYKASISNHPERTLLERRSDDSVLEQPAFPFTAALPLRRFLPSLTVFPLLFSTFQHSETFHLL